LPDVQRTTYTKKWEDTEEDLGRESFGELFSHIRMVYRKAKPQGTLLKEFREHVVKQTTSISLIDDVILPMASVYEELTDANYASPEHAEQVNECLKWLNRLEFNDWVPPALAFSVRHRNRPEKMESFFRDLERLAYSILVTRAGINERIERFSQLTQAIENSADVGVEGSPLQLSAGEQFETYGALSGPLYKTLSARARSTVLLRLDALLSGGGASYEYETVTVEHVLPQNPGTESEWVVWFPDAAVRANLVHQIGNLALLTRKKNSSASNYEFERKKAAYFSKGGVSPFVITTQVLRNAKWTAEIIEARQTELMAILESRWRLQGRKDPLEELLG
jgi:hypothetical protein